MSSFRTTIFPKARILGFDTHPAERIIKTSSRHLPLTFVPMDPKQPGVRVYDWDTPNPVICYFGDCLATELHYGDVPASKLDKFTAAMQLAKDIREWYIVTFNKRPTKQSKRRK